MFETDYERIATVLNEHERRLNIYDELIVELERKLDEHEKS
jgi:hypothetical protein